MCAFETLSDVRHRARYDQMLLASTRKEQDVAHGNEQRKVKRRRWRPPQEASDREMKFHEPTCWSYAPSSQEHDRDQKHRQDQERAARNQERAKEEEEKEQACAFNPHFTHENVARAARQ